MVTVLNASVNVFLFHALMVTAYKMSIYVCLCLAQSCPLQSALNKVCGFALFAMRCTFSNSVHQMLFFYPSVFLYKSRVWEVWLEGLKNQCTTLISFMPTCYIASSFTVSCWSALCCCQFNRLLPRYHNGPVTGMSTCIRKPLIATCSVDRSVSIWNYETW